MGDDPEPPEVPEFNPVNIPQAMARALAYDVSGFDWSDQDFLSRFPGLVAQREQQLDDAYQQLTGPLDATVSESFMKQGLQQGLGAFAGGDPMGALGLTEGSAGRNSAATSFANSALEKQTYDRQWFSQLLADNMQRSFGLGGGDVASLAALNTGGTNATNQMQYQSELAGIYGQGQRDAATAQQIATLGALLGRLGSG